MHLALSLSDLAVREGIYSFHSSCRLLSGKGAFMTSFLTVRGRQREVLADGGEAGGGTEVLGVLK